MSDRNSGEVGQWFAELQGLDGSDLAPADLKRWERWIEEPGNRQAFDRYTRTWKELERLQRPAVEPETLDGYDGSVSVAEWLDANRRPRRSAVYQWAAAAVLAALVVTGILHGYFGSDPDSAGKLVTAVGEHRHIRLSDGSVVTLGANSVLTVDYSPERRSAELVRGEALFKVGRDAQRPFVVKAGTATVRALGTAFNVLRGENRVVVTVTQGLVEVKPAASAAPARLGEGKQVTYSAKAPVGVVAEADPAAVLSWSEGKRRYRSEPLRSVIEDVNRYSRRRVILDPAVGDLEFTGVVFGDEVDSWTDGLRFIFPVELVEVDTNTLLVRPRTDSEKSP